MITANNFYVMQIKMAFENIHIMIRKEIIDFKKSLNNRAIDMFRARAKS